MITDEGHRSVIGAQYSIIQLNNILKWTFKNSTNLATPCLLTVWLPLFGKMWGLNSNPRAANLSRLHDKVNR